MFNKKDTILSKYTPPTQTLERVSPLGAAAHSESKSESKAASTPAALPGTPPASADEAGSRLVVGPNVKLKGAEIDDCDILVVEGRVEATMDSRVLRVAEKGAFSGKVGIDVAEIRGRFDGELTARSQLVIHTTGRVSGTIRYGKLLVEEGGELSGDIRSLSSERDAAGDTGRRQNIASAVTPALRANS
jgi:cytoskeletal protein CcmA (bactofilin family)